MLKIYPRLYFFKLTTCMIALGGAARRAAVVRVGCGKFRTHFNRIYREIKLSGFSGKFNRIFRFPQFIFRPRPLVSKNGKNQVKIEDLHGLLYMAVVYRNSPVEHKSHIFLWIIIENWNWNHACMVCGLWPHQFKEMSVPTLKLFSEFFFGYFVSC